MPTKDTAVAVVNTKTGTIVNVNGQLAIFTTAYSATQAFPHAIGNGIVYLKAIKIQEIYDDRF